MNITYFINKMCNGKYSIITKVGNNNNAMLVAKTVTALLTLKIVILSVSF